MKNRNRRRFNRVSLKLQAYIIDMADDLQYLPFDIMADAETIDFSEQGIQIRSYCHFKVGSFVTVVIFDGDRKSVCFSKIMWAEPGPTFTSYGLYLKQWIHLDEKLVEAISESKSLARLFNFHRFLTKPRLVKEAA